MESSFFQKIGISLRGVLSLFPFNKFEIRCQILKLSPKFCSDGEGVVFSVERLDPGGDPNSSTSHAAGDLLIPITVSRSEFRFYLQFNIFKF